MADDAQQLALEQELSDIMHRRCAAGEGGLGLAEWLLGAKCTLLPTGCAVLSGCAQRVLLVALNSLLIALRNGSQAPHSTPGPMAFERV